MIESVEHEWRNDHDTKNHCPAAGAFAGFEPHRLRQSGADRGHHRKNRADRPADCRGPERYRRGHRVCRSATPPKRRKLRKKPPKNRRRHPIRKPPQRKLKKLRLPKRPPSTKTASIPRRTTSRCICIPTDTCPPTSSRRRKQKSSAGPAGLSSRIPPANASAAAISETMRAFSPKRTAEATPSVTSTRWAPTSGVQKRIVFSNDGLIYYTEDHYETFELLYGEES